MAMIAQTIQLALAPVFVLVAIANIMNLLSTRLARLVDRSRHLQQLHKRTEGADHDAVVREIRIVNDRIDLVGRAILMLVLGGLCIGLTVVVLFLEEFLGIDVQAIAAGFFIAAIGCLMWGLLLFLKETRAAAASLRIPEMFLEKDRKL